MKKEMIYKTASGKEVKVVVDYFKSGNGFENDGFKVESTKVETHFHISFYNGKTNLGYRYDRDYCKSFSHPNHPNASFICGRLALTATEKENIDAFIEQVIAEYETPEELAEVAETKNAEKIYSAEEIEEAARKTREYNNLYNEGGEGYVPRFLKGEAK